MKNQREQKKDKRREKIKELGFVLLPSLYRDYEA